MSSQGQGPLSLANAPSIEASPGVKGTCPLCSSDLDMTVNCHSGCPMSKGCSLVRCPNCSYEFPDPSRSRLASLLQRWFGSDSQTQAGST